MKKLILVLFLITNCVKNHNILKNIKNTYKNINEELILAIKEGKIFQAACLINAGADVNYVNIDNKSVLDIALDKGDIKTIKLLLEEGIKISEERNILKIYELALDTSRYGIVEYDIIKLMEDKGYKLRDRVMDKNKHFLALCCIASIEELKKFIECEKIEPTQSKSVLNICLHNERTDIARFLIENYDLELNFKDKYTGNSPLLIACEKGYMDIINLLLDRNVDVNEEDIYYEKTALNKACSNDNLVLAKLLIEKGANVNHIDNFLGNTSLMYASCGSIEIVRLLLEHKADINIKNKYKGTALSYACSKGDIRIVELLLDSNIDINENDYALVSAAEQGNLEIVKLLLEKGFNLNAEDNKGFTPLMKAIENNHSEVVKILLEKGANINHRSKDEEEVTPLMLACQNSDIDTVKLMIERGVDIFEKNKEGATLIYYASLYNYGNDQEKKEDLIDILLDKGLNIDEKRYDGYTALMLASFENQANATRLLLKKGAKIDNENNNGSTALIIASQEGKKEVVKILLESGANIEHKNKYGSSPLIIASKNGHIEIVKILLEKGAKINEKNNNGNNSLILASTEEHEDIVELLLKKGANINEKNKLGQTALMITSNEKKFDIVELLLKKGANVNEKNEKGETALTLASKKGNLKVVKILLDAEANINHKANNGLTSLAIASANNNLELVDLLIKNLCDINIKDNNGFTSLMFSVHEGNVKIVDLLIKNGADINIKDKCGYSALMYALGKNNREIAKILLENFCEVDDKINLNNILEELIIEKIKNNDLENALILILNYKNRIKFNFKDGEDNTFLHHIAMIGDRKLFTLFLNNECNINSVNKKDETPLYYALAQEKINEVFVCYLLNKGANLGSKSVINGKPILDILSPFEEICNRLVYEPLIEKFSSPSSFSFNSSKLEIKDKPKAREVIKAIKLKKEDFINEIPMISFLKNILMKNLLEIKINLNESNVKGDLSTLAMRYLNLNVFNSIFGSFKEGDYSDNVLAKGIEESKKFFNETLTKIIDAKPFTDDSDSLKENEKSFKEFIAKKRLAKLINLIGLLKGTNKNDQKIKVALSNLLDNLVSKNGSLEVISEALRDITGKEIELKEIIDEYLINLRYELLKEVVNEEISKNNVSLEIEGEIYETAFTPYLLSHLTLSLKDTIKLDPIYEQHDVKYKYDKSYISKEILKRYESRMIHYLQDKTLEDKEFSERIKDYIGKEIFKGKPIYEVEDFIYDKENKLNEEALKALLINFNFLIPKELGGSFNFSFSPNNDFKFDTNFKFNFENLNNKFK